MDKMVNNEFCNGFNPKISMPVWVNLYRFEVKFPHLSLKTTFSSEWSQNDHKILPHVKVKFPY